MAKGMNKGMDGKKPKKMGRKGTSKKATMPKGMGR